MMIFLKKNNDASNNNELLELDNFIQSQNQRFRRVKIDFKKYRDSTRLHLDVNMGSSDLSKFYKKKKIGNGSFGNVYLIANNQSNIVYAAKVSIYEIDQCLDDTVLNLTREIEIISSLYHPSILRFIGYCPKNFKSKPKPVIITEFAPNGSLENILKMEREGLKNIDWNDTKKLINIYGIASGMAFLESRLIIHRDLKPANILLDEYLYPKIADFGMSKTVAKDSQFFSSIDFNNSVKSGFKGTLAYSAPEILSDYHYTQKGDVFSFAMIMYEIMTGELPFAGYNKYQVMMEIVNGIRPKFNVHIPYCYKNLIQKCWSDNSQQRPSFTKIRNILETDPNFITQNVNEEEYRNYIDYMNEFQQSNIKNENYQKQEQKINTVKLKISSLLNEIEKTEDESYDFFLDLNKYEKQQIIIKKDIIKIYQICENETNNLFSAHMSMIANDQITKDEIEKLSSEIKIISKFSHPSLLNFIGFSLNGFKNDRKPVIVTELVTNGTLEQILQLEKSNQKIYGWDNTKKLINIFGIASGMSYMHSLGIIHCCLDPSNIYLNDMLLPKIGEYSLLTRFINNNNMTHQSMTGEKGTSIYSAPEVIADNQFSKSSDVYSFALVVYEILTNEKPFVEIDKTNQIYKKIVIDGERPKMKETIPLRFQKLIKQCWSQNPDERPEFNEIVNQLKIDSEFINEEINKEDYQKYINFIDSHTRNEINQQINEPHQLELNTIISEEAESPKNSKIDLNSNDIISNFFVENQNDFNFCLADDINPKESIIKIDTIEQMPIILELISSRNVKKLMNFLNNCDDETSSFVFNKCYYESRDLFLDLCKEGISSQNAIAHHKYAISLVFIINESESRDFQKKKYKEAIEHFNESIKLGYLFSYFSLSRLYYEVYKDKKLAFKTAQEGSEKGEKYSTCLYCYFITHGIGTKKNLIKGVSFILSSKANDFYVNFANEIGIYYSMINKEEQNQKEIFKWFEKAFNMKKTKATINNYGICFMKGIGVDKNITKAIEIFKIGTNQNDSNSMYHLAFLLEKISPKESLKYYKLSAELGDPRSQFIYAISIEKNNPNLALKFYIKAAKGGNINAQEFLVFKYAKENDTENTLKYIHLLINEGRFDIPLKYAVSLYKSKNFKQAWYIFSILEKINHPIAMYFIGVMLYRGEGCDKNKNEAQKILEKLSNSGINEASEFLENYEF